MKVVHLYKDYFPPTVGGIEQTVDRIARGTRAAGADVTVLTSNPGARRTLREAVNGVKVIRCAEFGRALSTPFCPSMPSELARLDADLFHLHYPSPPGEVSWLLARPRGVMVLSWYCDIVRQKAVLPVYGHVIRAVLRRAEAILPIYEGQAESSNFIAPHLDKRRLVPLGIELGAFERTAEIERDAAALRQRIGTPLIVFVGRLVTYKGLDVLLRAMREVDARLVVVGGGPEEARLRSLAAEFGVADRVTFTGRVEAGVLLRHLAAADAGVLPSVTRAEAFGLSMVEMMSMGLPVVCTDVGTGTPFVNLDGVTGYVVPPRDPAALAAALTRLLADDASRRAMGERARERARTLFDAQAMVRGVLAVYEEVLARKRREA